MKMIKIITVLGLLAITVSCTRDFLELDPLTSLVESNFYQSEEDAFMALVAVYDVLQWGTPKNQNVPIEVISEIASDNCYGGGSNANDIPGIVDIDQHEMDPAYVGYEALWYKYYFGIYRANLLLERIEGIEFKNDNLKKRFIAEARFLRANYYFDAVRLFGNIPLILKPLAPSEYSQEQDEPSRVYAQILKDLQKAVYVLPEIVPPSETGRITRWAAEALAGRVFLYYTGYYNETSVADGEGFSFSADSARKYIDNVILNGGFDLMTDYEDLWKVENNNNFESVFEIQYTELSRWGDWGYRIGSEANQAVVLWGVREPDESSPYAPGWSFGPVNPKLYNAYDPADTRRNATILSIADEFDPNGWAYLEGFQHTGFFNKKFIPLKEHEATIGDSRLNYPNNYPVIRFADVLLMGAELFLTENPTKAQDYYDRVRKRAFGEDHTPPVLSGQAGMNLIMEERYLELALEGHRYWDLLRQGVAYAESQIDQTGNEYPFFVDFKPETMGLFPIPQSEIDLTNRSLIQNDGYN
ncbi:MAG: RagB/SusD family nutrient uptake outer membrane protein [Bacteroidales bacterium]